MGELSTVRVSPTYTSTELFTPHSHIPRSTLPAISKFIRPVQNRLNPWGTVHVNYGGMGKAVFELKPTSYCCTSRGHGHFGTGCINSSNAPEQPYRLTSLLLSKCRPTDQLLPLPLMSNLIHERKLKCPCPKYSSTSLNSSHVNALSTQDTACRQIASSYYSSTYRRDYQNHWSSHKHKSPENILTSVGSCYDNADQITMVHDTDDTESIIVEADGVDEVAIDMVDDQKEVKDMATQTDFNLTVVMCAWEKHYNPKNKKEYFCAPLQLKQSSSTKYINDKDESSPKLNKAVQTSPLVHFPLVQQSKTLSFSQLPTNLTSRLPIKLPEVSDAVCQTTDIETTRITQNSKVMITAKPQLPPRKMNQDNCTPQRLNSLYPETVPSFSLTRREGKRQYFYGYHSSVFRG